MLNSSLTRKHDKELPFIPYRIKEQKQEDEEQEITTTL